MKFMIYSSSIFFLVFFFSSCQSFATNKNTLDKTILKDTIPKSKQIYRSLSESFDYDRNTYKDNRIRSYAINLKELTIDMVWKNKNDKPYASIRNLINEENHDGDDKKVIWAMNAGMFKKDFSPQGLYIENGEILSPLDKNKEGFGNFYLQPNGVFLISEDATAQVVSTADFTFDEDIKYATQSGPMLVVDGKINDKLTEGSSNLHFRNAVGILPDGKILYAITPLEKINFYDLALFFQKHGCQQALYLDGFVSALWDPNTYSEDVDKDHGVIMVIYNEY